MAVNGFALAGLGAGAIFLYTAIKGKSILATTQAIIQGKTPANVPATNTINTTSGTDAANAIVPNTNPPSIGTVKGAVTGSGGNAGNSKSSYQAYAFSLFPQYGWGTDQEQPLIDLWNRESNWDPTAYFPSTHTTNPDNSHAFGIPQALPADKMASAGPDWRTNAATQIRWGLGYISSVYHNPQGAWDHEKANGWY